MKKNGFVFIETIVAIVVLTAALLLLYSSFNKILQSEKTRIYYDNISYVYRTWNIQKMLNDYDINDLINSMRSNEYLITDIENGSWISENKEIFNDMLNDFQVSKIIVLKTDKLNELKKCPKDSNNSNCKKLSDNLKAYLKTISFTTKPINILVVEFNSQSNEKKFYSWVGVNE